MWIKHNKALYNTNDMKKIEIKGYKILATFFDGEEVVLGSFRSVKECEGILHSISSALLFEDKDHPGLIIKNSEKRVVKE